MKLTQSQFIKIFQEVLVRDYSASHMYEGQDYIVVLEKILGTFHKLEYYKRN